MLRTRRNDLALSQDEVAATAGVTVTTLRQWEFGRSMPELEAMTRLSTALRLPLVRLLAGYGLAGQDAEDVASAIESGTSTPGSLGTVLRAARKRCGFTTFLTGPLIGTDRTMISKYEFDRQRPNLATVVKLGRAVEADFNELMAAYTA